MNAVAAQVISLKIESMSTNSNCGLEFANCETMYLLYLLHEHNWFLCNLTQIRFWFCEYDDSCTWRSTTGRIQSKWTSYISDTNPTHHPRLTFGITFSGTLWSVESRLLVHGTTPSTCCTALSRQRINPMCHVRLCTSTRYRMIMQCEWMTSEFAFVLQNSDLLQLQC